MVYYCKYSITFFFFIFYGYLAHSQNTKQHLPNLKEANVLNYRALIDIWRQELHKLPAHEGQKYAEKALKDALESPIKALVPHAYLLQAEIFHRNDQKLIGYERIFEAYQYATKHELPYEIAQTSLQIANMYVLLQEYAKSLPYAYKAKEIFEKEKAPLELTQSCYYIGLSLYKSKDYFAAEQFLSEALAKGEKLLPNRERINAWNTMALIHSKQKNYKQSLLIFEKALNIAQDAQDSTWVGILFGNMGNIWFEQKDYTKAQQMLEIDLAYSLKGKEYGSAITALIRLGDIHAAIQQPKKAINYYQTAIKQYQEAKLKGFDALVMAYGGLAKAHYALENYDTAHVFYEKTIQIKDSAYNNNKDLEIIKMKNSLEFLHVSDKVGNLEQENKIQQKLIKEIKNQQNILMVGILLVLFILVILANYYWQNNVKNKLLKKKNQEMHKQSQELIEKQTELDAQQQDISYKNNQLALINQKLIDNEEIISKQKEKLEEEVVARTEEIALKNEELIQYTQQLEQFAYVTAHNVRAPVARILGLASIVDKENFANPFNITVIEKIQAMAKELDTIIYDLNTILELEKSEKPPIEIVNLEEKINKIMKILDNEIDENQVEIQMDWQGDKYTQAISLYIESILYNLISNAIKYRSPQRKPFIKIKTERKHNLFIMTITDNGLGIDTQKYSAKLFNLYQRFHDHVEGKGMGLHLVKLQVEALGGTITLDSTPNIGTTFTIQLKQN